MSKTKNSIPKNFGWRANYYRNENRRKIIEPLLLEYDINMYNKWVKEYEKSNKKLTKKEKKIIIRNSMKSTRKLAKDRSFAAMQWREIVHTADALEPFVSREDYLDSKQGKLFFTPTIII